MNLDFEWDDLKAAENVRHHGVSFAQAAVAFRDPFAVEWIDLREPYGEERIILLGMTSNQVLSVVYTERAERIRIISARRATKMSKTTTIAKMRRNGRLVRVKPDGTEEALDTPSLPPRSVAEIEAAAARDHDNPPLADARPGQLRPVPRVKTLRRALALTQEEFAARYHIPLDTLRDWERGRSEPDQPAKAYLTVIARDPEAVERALQPVPD